MSTTVLETLGLVKSFGEQVAVNNVSITVRQGDIYGFLGLNGAGKTTTMRLILGLIRADSGEVGLFGRRDGAGRIEALGRIGAMVEGPAFYGHLSGARNLELLGSLSGPVAETRVESTLKQVGLWEARGKKASAYSLGMKQRLGIALALVSEPELVILDEPTNGLDPNGILEMRRLIRRLNQDDGVTFLISSHLLHEIELVCSRVGILEEGHLNLEEDIADLVQKLGGHYVLQGTDSPGTRQAIGAFDGLELLEGAEDGAIRFTLAPDRLPALHRHLAEHQIGFTTLAEKRVTLEDFFLDQSGQRAQGELT